MRFFRADAAFAIPELYEMLEAEGYFYTIRLKGNAVLQEAVAPLLKRPVARPPNFIHRYSQPQAIAEALLTIIACTLNKCGSTGAIRDGPDAQFRARKCLHHVLEALDIPTRRHCAVLALPLAAKVRQVCLNSSSLGKYRINTCKINESEIGSCGWEMSTESRCMDLIDWQRLPEIQTPDSRNDNF